MVFPTSERSSSIYGTFVLRLRPVAFFKKNIEKFFISTVHIYLAHPDFSSKSHSYPSLAYQTKTVCSGDSDSPRVREYQELSSLPNAELCLPRMNFAIKQIKQVIP